MHIANAVQATAIVIFGPTCELKNSPLYKAFALSHDIRCRPCQYDNKMNICQDPKCMTELKPEVVIQKMQELVKPVHPFCA